MAFPKRIDWLKIPLERGTGLDPGKGPRRAVTACFTAIFWTLLGLLSLGSSAQAVDYPGLYGNIGKRYTANATLRPDQLDLAPAQVTPETSFNNLYYFQIHNTMDHGASITGWLNTGYRTLEIDVLDFYGGWVGSPGGPYVSHDTPEAVNGCLYQNRLIGLPIALADCFKNITEWLDRNDPEVPIVVFVDMKTTINDLATAWPSDRVAELDRWIGHTLGDRLFSYSDMQDSMRANYSNMRTRLDGTEWPRMRELNGKVIVALTGGRYGQVNQGMRDALLHNLGGRANAFFCPDGDAGDEYEIDHAIDGMTQSQSEAFICANLAMGDHADDVLQRASQRRHMIHIYGSSGDYDPLEYGYNYMATSLGAQFIGWDYGGNDYHNPWFTADEVLPFVGTRADLPAFFELVYHGSNRCLDVWSANAKNGARTAFYPCNGTDAQKWYITAEGQIRPKVDNRYCLDIQGAKLNEGQPLHLWDCDGGNSEKWYMRSDSKIATLHNRNLCIRASTDEHTSAYLSNCSNNDPTLRIDRIKVAPWLSNNK